MIALLQRVSEASVLVNENSADGGINSIINGEIGAGILALVAIEKGDTEIQADRLLQRILAYRMFEDDSGRMNLNLSQSGGELLLVSQFTLYGNCRKGMRPSFIGSAPPDLARNLYREFGELLRQQWATVSEGEFGAMMEVSLINDGPVTLIIDREAAAPGGSDD